MKIKYLGTAAAEGVPAIFCDCEVCRRSRQAGGRNIRTRSQALIDGKILLDLPADTYLHALRDGIDMTAIADVFITHGHRDHFYPEDLFNRQEGFCQLTGNGGVPTLTVHAPAPACANAYALAKGRKLGSRLQIEEITPFVPVKIDDYTITPLKANHDPACEPVIYLIEHDGKSILYAHDTGYLPEESMEFLKGLKSPLSLVSMDGTSGLLTADYYGHMTLTKDRVFKQQLLDLGIADENTKMVINHFSHNCHATYDDFVEATREDGFTVSYDGLEIEV